MMPVDDVSKNLSFSGSRYRAHRQHWRTVLTVARELAFTNGRDSGRPEGTGPSRHSVVLPSSRGEALERLTGGNADALTASLAVALACVADRLGYLTGSGEVRFWFSSGSAADGGPTDGPLPAVVGDPATTTVGDALLDSARCVAASRSYRDYPYTMLQEHGRGTTDAPFERGVVLTVGRSGTSADEAGVGGRPRCWLDISKTVEGYRLTLRAPAGSCDAPEAEAALSTVADVVGRLRGSRRLLLADLVDDVLEQSPASMLAGPTPAGEAAAPSLSDLLTRVVTAHRDESALTQGGRSMTYGELDAHAERLAGRVLDHIGREKLVGMIVRPSIDCIIGMLACIKASVGFVPLDPDSPESRLSAILSDGEPAAVMAGPDDDEVVMRLGLPRLPLESACDTGSSPALPDLPDETPDDVAYVIYTSGSTGRPKGVKVTRANVANYLSWFVELAELSPADNALLVSSMAFDLGYSGVLGALSCGACLHVIPKSTYRDTSKLLRYIADERITFIKMTPSLFSLVVDELRREQFDLAALRLVVLGGERLRVDDVESLKEILPSTRVMNHYGPTETTIGSLAGYYEAHRDAFRRGRSIIGTPVAGTKVYITNDDLKPQPAGVAGEIVVSGAAVGAGYVNDDELTARSFVDFPADGSPAYRTGDRGRLLPGIGVEYLGRVDDQVKVHGYRVDTHEVETAVLKTGHVHEAVVVPIETTTGVKLAAYCTTDPEFDEESARSEASRLLPSYMVPAWFVEIDEIPLTANGKVDRAALPEPRRAGGTQSGHGPSNDLEMRILSIWRDVLALDHECGVDEEFLSLGGDSIQAMQIAGRLRAIGVEAEVAEILNGGTVRRLAQTSAESSEIETEPERHVGPVPCGPMISRWMERVGYWDHWNQAFAFHVDAHVDDDALALGFERLVERHDMLRVRAVLSGQDDGLSLVIDGDTTPSAHITSDSLRVSGEIAPDLIQEVADRLHRDICPRRALNLSYCLIESDGEQVLVVAIHHLVVDGVSWRIICEELSALIEDPGARLPAVRTPYPAWVERMSSAWGDDIDLAYWGAQAESGAGGPSSDHGSQRDATVVRRTFDGGAAQSILTDANSCLSTNTGELIVAALSRPLSDLLGVSDFDICIESHGRFSDESLGDPSGAVGWFTSSYPIHVDGSAEDVRDRIVQAKETMRGVPSLGASYNYLRYSRKVPAGPSEPVVCINFLGDWRSGGHGSGGLTPLPYDTGEWRDPDSPLQYALTIDAISVGEGLSIRATFSSGEIDEGGVRRLLMEFERDAAELVRYCSDPAHAEKTASDFSGLDLPQDQFEALVDGLPGERRSTDVDDILPMSPCQRTMWRDSCRTPRTVQPYYHSRAFRVRGPLDATKIEEASGRLARRHSALRTVVTPVGDAVPVQVVLKDARIPITLTDIGNLSADEIGNYLESRTLVDAALGYRDPGQPLTRVEILRVSPDDHFVIWSNSHLILDGWSRMTLLSELIEMLRAPESLEREGAGGFGEYIRFNSRPDVEREALSYWEDYLAGYETVSLFDDGGRIEDSLVSLREIRTSVRGSVMQRIEDLSAAENVTVSAALQVLVGLAIARACGCDDVTMATVVSDRPAAIRGIGSMVGPLVNTVPVRVRRNGGETVGDLARRRVEEVLEGGRFAYFFDPYLGDPDAMCVRLAIETYEVPDSVRGTFMDRRIIDDMRMTDRVGGDLVIFIVPGDGVSVSIQANPVRISAERQKELLDQLVEYIVLLSERGFGVSASAESEDVRS